MAKRTKKQNTARDIVSNFDAHSPLYAEQDAFVEFTDLTQIVEFIMRKFNLDFNSMYILSVCKKGVKRQIFNAIRSAPLLDPVVETNGDSPGYCLKFESEWNAEVAEESSDKKKSEKDIEFGDGKKWGEINTEFERFAHVVKNKMLEYDNSDDDLIDSFPAKLFMRINNIEHVFVYNWGFELVTGSPIDVFFVKRSSIMNHKKHEQSTTAYATIHTEDHIIRKMMSDNDLIMPNEVCDVKELRACWHMGRESAKDAEIETLLSGKIVDRSKPKKIHMPDVGQIRRDIVL
jgi:hypothetical protein